MLAISRALMLRPRLLLLDEPSFDRAAHGSRVVRKYCAKFIEDQVSILPRRAG